MVVGCANQACDRMSGMDGRFVGSGWVQRATRSRACTRRVWDDAHDMVGVIRTKYKVTSGSGGARGRGVRRLRRLWGWIGTHQQGNVGTKRTRCAGLHAFDVLVALGLTKRVPSLDQLGQHNANRKHVRLGGVPATPRGQRRNRCVGSCTRSRLAARHPGRPVATWGNHVRTHIHDTLYRAPGTTPGRCKGTYQ